MLKILQLSDTHLHADESVILNGVSPQKNFNQLIEHIKPRIASLNAIFLTGDISQDKTAESYCRIAESLQVFKKPVYWFAGNHDDPEVMHDTLAQFSYFTPLTSLVLGDWQFLVVDTVRENTDAGYIVENTQSLIKKNTFCALLMHHHPVPVGTPLIDKYKVQNPELLETFLFHQEKMPELIITGHVHGDYQMDFLNIPVITSPATCFQFPKESTKLAVDHKAGCTLWTLDTNGVFDYEYIYT